MRGVAGVERELGRRGLQGLEHDVAAKPHPLPLDDRTRLLEDFARLGKEHVQADILEYLQRMKVDRLDLIIGDDARRLDCQARLLPRQLLDRCVSAIGTAAAAFRAGGNFLDGHGRRA